MLSALRSKLIAHSGQAALSTIFLIGGMIVLFAIALAAVALSFLNSTLGFRAATQAQAIALGGIHDAEIQILRNSQFADDYCVPYYASVPCPVDYARVTVTQNSPSVGMVTVISDATHVRRRKLQAIYTFASSTQLNLVSLKVLSL